MSLSVLEMAEQARGNMERKVTPQRAGDNHSVSVGCGTLHQKDGKLIVDSAQRYIWGRGREGRKCLADVVKPHTKTEDTAAAAAGRCCLGFKERGWRAAACGVYYEGACVCISYLEFVGREHVSPSS